MEGSRLFSQFVEILQGMLPVNSSTQSLLFLADTQILVSESSFIQHGSMKYELLNVGTYIVKLFTSKL